MNERRSPNLNRALYLPDMMHYDQFALLWDLSQPRQVP